MRRIPASRIGKRGRDRLVLYKAGESCQVDPREEWDAERKEYLEDLKAEFKNSNKC